MDKKLERLLDKYQVISIVGNVKNAGKTTVLNYLISSYQNLNVAITSIGLDGEKIDQVNFLPKPRIFVHAQMLVATAKDCLKECEAKYEIIKETNIKTSLGLINIIKITKPGNCLVGGPSSINQMKDLILELKKLNSNKILLDGAFQRTALVQLADATILAIGASYSTDIKATSKHASNTVKLFQLPKYIGKHDLSKYSEIVFINENDELIFTNNKSTLDQGNDIISKINKDIKYIYIPKAVSKSFIKAFINNRSKIKADLIVNTPTNLILDEKLLNHLFKLQQKIFVLEEVNLVAVTYNPFSPKGNVDSNEFRIALENEIKIPIFNVLEKS